MNRIDYERRQAEVCNRVDISDVDVTAGELLRGLRFYRAVLLVRVK